jgi:hypothetical protein
MTVLRQTLSDTIEWVIERIEGDNWDFGRIKFQLAYLKNAKLQL